MENVKIDFLRHSETDWSEKRILQGKTDTPLSSFGLKNSWIRGQSLNERSMI